MSRRDQQHSEQALAAGRRGAGLKIEGWLFVGCSGFFLVTCVVYGLWSKDPTGTAALALAVGLAGLTGFYLLYTGSSLGRRPEDDQQGEIYQGTGELGFFSPHSWWPLFLGLSAAVATAGVAIGWWLFLIGAMCIILSTIGFVFEYYRGHYAH